MIEIKGYKQIGYSDFRSALAEAFKKSGKLKIQVAASIKVNSPATISNALEAEVKQKVSDEVLTSVMKSVGLSGFVIWNYGKKYYYIKNEN